MPYGTSQGMRYLRSKGIPGFNKRAVLDVRQQAIAMAVEIADIFKAALTTFANLSWTAWIAIALTIITTGADFTIMPNKTDSSIFLVFFAFITLPLLAMTILVVQRRDTAHTRLGQAKAALVAISLQASTAWATAASVAASPQPQHASWGEHAAQAQSTMDVAADVRHSLAAVVDDLHRYLSHKRPNARHFLVPYKSSQPTPGNPLAPPPAWPPPLPSCLIPAAPWLKATKHSPPRSCCTLTPVQQRGWRRWLRSRVVLRQAGNQGLGLGWGLGSRASGAGWPGVLVCPVQLLRAVQRWFVVVLMPAFLAHFWMAAAKGLGAALAGTMGVLLQLSLMVLMDVAISLEDPFDEAALDGISCFEALDHIAAMTSEEGMEAEYFPALVPRSTAVPAYFMPRSWQSGGERPTPGQPPDNSGGEGTWWSKPKSRRRDDQADGRDDDVSGREAGTDYEHVFLDGYGSGVSRPTPAMPPMPPLPQAYSAAQDLGLVGSTFGGRPR
ncbi:hypothetical protein V8C86DRAFT_3026924 [Haematococcus lacustris]